MAYKIYTYEDPYQLDKTDFWAEISSLPHFCVSRTLVNGFVDFMQDSIGGLICPLDKLVSHEKVYRSWTANISLRIRQHTVLTALFRRKLEEGSIDERFHAALLQNQTQFLDAIRLFIELDISHAALDSRGANREQRLFIDILREIQTTGDAAFRFPITPDLGTLQETMVLLAQSELEEFEEKKGDRQSPHVQKKREWHRRAVQAARTQPLKAVVVHGVHQFSPAQLRLLLALERMGLTVIFLFNYQKRFPEIYASWKYIYQCFGVPLHHDKNIPAYKPPALQTPSNALAMALGELCEGRLDRGEKDFAKWFDLYGDIGLQEFANITEYAHFVSDRFGEAIQSYRSELSVMGGVARVWDNSAVLRRMEEQVYTANREVHTLLKLYYPEYSKDRHFLSYPIGQFFSALYRLWNWERGEINLEEKAVKECLSSGILQTGPPEELLRTYCTLSILLADLDSFSQFQTEIKGDYLRRFDQVTNAKEGERVAALKQLSIYNAYKVRRGDIQMLVAAMEELNDIGVRLFALDSAGEDYISFGNHFQRLEEFIRLRQPDLILEEERALILALSRRLDKIDPGRSAFSGTFRDLREGLHFYLKQEEDVDQVDWIVKNFEQIDGDVLQSMGQAQRGEEKVYHFACLSDRDMSCPVDDLLPWPLSDAFIRRAYSPVELQFQAYYASLGEREGFLRYALFYGLCFNRCGLRLSFVRQYGDEGTTPYSLLTLLGLRPKEAGPEEADRPSEVGVTIKAKQVDTLPYNRYGMMSLFLCPYRYFLEYVLSEAPILEGEFLYQKFYENLLVAAVWPRIEGQSNQLALDGLDALIDRESRSFRPYFPFWKATEFYDLERRAKNYLIHRVIHYDENPEVRGYREDVIKIRQLFGVASYHINIAAREPCNPYWELEEQATFDLPNNKKIYSLLALPRPEQVDNKKDVADALIQGGTRYLSQTREAAVVADWCAYCTNRSVCMRPFLLGQ